MRRARRPPGRGSESRWRPKLSVLSGACRSGRRKAARNKDAREARRTVDLEKREEAARLEAEHAQTESSLNAQLAQLEISAARARGLAAGSGADDCGLAGLEEPGAERRRRSSASTAVWRSGPRMQTIEQQRTAATAEREQR